MNNGRMRHPGIAHKTVVVGLSGGVDSSLTAALLQAQGYNVIGVYMKNWSSPIKGVEHCPWIGDQLDARRIAAQLDIAFYTVNFEAEYKQRVVDAFLADYQAGRTPNPDVLCNQFIKFDHFWRYAQSLGANFIATGHYSRIEVARNQTSQPTERTYTLLRGSDCKKDQSYFLWAINQAVLPHILMPLGSMTKHEVRAKAKQLGLVTASKKDSQGICFIGQADIRDFLRQRLGHQTGFKPGVMLNMEGKIVGEHKGAGFYTIGQRAGIANIKTADMTHRPIYYVITTDIKNNTITIGEDIDLYSSTLKAADTNWLADIPRPGAKLTAKIRYGQTPQPCVMVKASSSRVWVCFDAPQRAITPGQSLVLYDGDILVGGGKIT